MNADRFDRLIRHVGAASRRSLLHGATGLGAALVTAALLSGEAEARNKRRKGKHNKHKGRKGKDKGKGKNGNADNLCRADGSTCTKKGAGCQTTNCLQAPLTIEARWTAFSDHDTFLFVPNESGSVAPFPYVNYTCNPEDSACEDDRYPFVCVSQDATGPGDEITTLRQLLEGTYEYWLELDLTSPAGEVTVVLRNANGRIVRTWSNPETSSLGQPGWHIFDRHVSDGKPTLASVDVLGGIDLPESAHAANTFVCAI